MTDAPRRDTSSIFHTLPLDTFGLCIAGTDTDVGKTTVTAALLLAARRFGLRPVGIKPVQTGCLRSADCTDADFDPTALIAPDVSVYQDACPGIEASALIMLEEACSPHLATRRRGLTLNSRDLAARVCERLSELSDYASGCRDIPTEGVKDAPDREVTTFAAVESAGGVLTPLSESETMLDLFAALGFPVLLVVGNRLGAVNQALLSAAAIRARGVPMAGFVLTSPQEGKKASPTTQAILEDNGAIINRMTGLELLATLPHIPDLHAEDPALRHAAWEQTASALTPALVAILHGNASLRLMEGAEALGRQRLFSEDLLRFDRKHIWHPYTSATKPTQVREVTGSRGVYIHLADGRELIDGMSSWWCAVHGYNHPRLLAALHDQAERMPHVMFGGLTHEPAVTLARRLLKMAPNNLEHVFFADSGSVAVEVALKMAVQYQQACGKTEKSQLITVRGGYHGDTLGAMSVCDPETGMHSLFKGILPKQIFAPRPNCRFDAPYDPSSALELEMVMVNNAHRTAAVILEPIVQGAGGMWLYHPHYLRRVSELCREYDCLLILDEIATGFGRTGKLFACQWAEIEPDILCLGKALTGGVMTLSTTLASARVACGISQNGGVLMHGPTFMANPLACAVACASLELLADDPTFERVQAMEKRIRHGLEPCRELPGVVDVRVLGAIGVLEMDAPVQVEKVQNYCIDKHDCWIRPFGHNIYIMPPYVALDKDIDCLTTAMRGAVEKRQWI